MATVRFSLGPSKSLEDVVDAAGAAVVTAPVELTVDQASSVVTEGASTRIITKNEVLLCLEIFMQYIVRRNWP